MIPGGPSQHGRPEARACPLVLVIAADPVSREMLQLTLELEGFAVHQAPGPVPALALLEHDDFSVVLADYEVLEHPEHDLLNRAAIRQPYASMVALSSVFAVHQAMAQVSAGRLFGFVTKPWLREELVATVAGSAAAAATRRENAGLRQELRDLNTTAAHLKLRLDTQGAELDATLRGLAAAGQLRQRSLESALQFCHHLLAARHARLAARHHQLVALARKFSQLESFSPEAARQLVLGAALCDVGMLGFDHALLERLHGGGAPWSDADRDIYETHPLLSYHLACHFDPDPAIAEIVRNHHEGFDGSGFPQGLKGDAIPWLARCLAVAVHLVENPALHPAALEAVIGQSGRTLDPAAVTLFCRIPGLVDDPALFRAPQPGEFMTGLGLAAPLYGAAGSAFHQDRQFTTEDLVKKLAPPVDPSTQLGQRLHVLG